MQIPQSLGCCLLVPGRRWGGGASFGLGWVLPLTPAVFRAGDEAWGQSMGTILSNALIL